MKAPLRVLAALMILSTGVTVAPAQGLCRIATDPEGDPAGVRNAFGRIPGDEPGAIDILSLSMGVELARLVSEIAVSDLEAPPGAFAESTGWVVAWRFGNEGDYYFVEADRGPAGTELRATRVHNDIAHPFDVTGSLDLARSIVRLEIAVSDIMGASPSDEITDVHSWAQDRSDLLDPLLPGSNVPVSNDNAPDATSQWVIFPPSGVCPT